MRGKPVRSKDGSDLNFDTKMQADVQFNVDLRSIQNGIRVDLKYLHAHALLIDQPSCFIQPGMQHTPTCLITDQSLHDEGATEANLLEMIGSRITTTKNATVTLSLQCG